MTFRTASLALLPLLSAASQSSYSYEAGASNGPENWGSLTGYDKNECNGQSNSPIAIETDVCTTYGDYVFSAGTCQSADFSYEISDHNVQVGFPSECEPYTMQVPGVDTTYNAAQFHIHTSSEHTIDGEYYAAELHIVHVDANDDTAYAVAGMMITPDNPSNHEMFDVFLAGWEAVASAVADNCTGTPSNSTTSSSLGSGRRLQTTADMNIYDLIPADSSFYVYSGGLTTPPCSQVVAWNFADKPVKISVSQYNRLVNLIMGYVDPSTCELATVASSTGSTSRPPVALNGRTVGRICPESMKVNQNAATGEGSSASMLTASAAAAATFAAMFAM